MEVENSIGVKTSALLSMLPSVSYNSPLSGINLGSLSISIFTTFAGLPATIQLAGTSFVTTLHAATIEFSPIVTPLFITEFRPIHTLSQTTIGLETVYFQLRYGDE